MTASATIAKPPVTVVVVADYKAGEGLAWDEMRLTLEGLARQDFDEPVEFLLVEAEEAAADIPEELLQILPELKVVHSSGRTSYDFKNAGAEAASSDFVVILDADCAPHPNWLRSVMEHHRQNPQAAAISGRTLYKTDGIMQRAFALVDRGYVDTGRPGRTSAISNNNGAFARDTMLKYPLKNDVGPFGSKPQADEILADGGELRFEPGMVAYHCYGGWQMARETRPLTGYAMARYRKINPEGKSAWMYRIGLLGIPAIVALSILNSCKKSVKLHNHYGVRWYQLPIVWYVAVRSHMLEIPGLLRGMRDAPMDFGNAYR